MWGTVKCNVLTITVLSVDIGEDSLEWNGDFVPELWKYRMNESTTCNCRKEEMIHV